MDEKAVLGEVTGLFGYRSELPIGAALGAPASRVPMTGAFSQPAFRSRFNHQIIAFC